MKSPLTTITHLYLDSCTLRPNFLSSIKWETLDKLVYLAIIMRADYRYVSEDERFKLCSVNKNIRHLTISGVQMNYTGISFKPGYGFPELRSLKFENFEYGIIWDDADLKAFRYCCANSPKLEEISVSGYFGTTETYDSVAHSIGSLLSRPALRKLELEIFWSEPIWRDPPVRFVESIINLIRCPDEKPNLEHLILHPNCPLSSIYEFVNGNYNLKSLELHGEIGEDETPADLIEILNCESGLETLRFGGSFVRSVIPKSVINEFAIRVGGLWNWVKWSRDEFPKLVEDLRKIIEMS